VGLIARIAAAAASFAAEREELTSLKITFPGSSWTGGRWAPSSTDARLSSWIPARGSSVDYTAVDSLASSIVMACVNSVTRVFPEARLRVMRSTADGSEEAANHPAAALVAEPNPFMSADEFWQATNVDYDVRGNAYWWKVRRGARVAELFPLPAALMRARWPRDGSVYISHYELWSGREWMRLEVEDVVHFRNGIDWSPGSDGRYGLSPLRPVMRDIYADEEGGSYTSAILRNAGVVGAVFSPSAALFRTDAGGGATFSLTDDEREAMQAAYRASYGGDNRGLPLMFEIPIDVKKVAFSPADMTLDAIHRKAEARISALLNVPPIVAGLQVGLERSTYSNTEQALRALWTNNIVPRQRAMAGKLTAQLLPDLGREGEFFAFDNSQVEALQESRSEADERAARLFTSGVITRNQALARVGEPQAPEGDVYYQSLNVLFTPAGEEAARPALRAASVAGYLAAKADDLAPTAEDWPEVRRVLAELEAPGLLDRFDGSER
jgi:HK97 family phage portal protein